MNGKSRTSLFLMEMIIAVFFFAVTSAICAQVFAKAHLVSAHTSELNQAVFHTENIAETFRSANGSFNGPSASFYDENWQECPEETAVYRISVRTADESTVKKIRISVSRQISDEIIYSVDVCKYPRLEAVYE
ncbi:hypothetical protein [Frisingicoccus sp.]|jgi:Tfp pilus assembly protein PilE|uniref:hypothetical protein n=1 Tax=Frisingicoccus sp. TaxID=1918627 RepID=UPI002E75D748|nr:hypothetical protein [Frisingicoccus sp.]MEE0753163.1 hypothetical protein [Frisingicoccus sp.]